MNTKERHTYENESRERREAHNETAESLTANGRNRDRKNTVKTNRLWMWLGVLVLVFILLYWLFTIGIFDSLTGAMNG